jgi:hypothetical protein
MRIKKLISTVLVILMLSVMVMPIETNAANTDAPSRIINLVYDDSGSMIETDILDASGIVIKHNELVDTWCQAKYAIEVFAALLGENDTLNIYVMSEYHSPKLILKGSDGAGTNVSKVHNMITRAGTTPFESVRRAYSNLAGAKADEKWLVVLTDGEFQGVDSIDAYFAKKADDIKVMFLGMGSQADGITPNEQSNIYYREAKTNSEILKQITTICTQIFNSDRLDVNTASKVFSFDVPMGELVVFAQGANVQINGIKNSDGKLFKSTTTPVTVKYSDKAALNYDKFIVARDLLGSIATFKDDFIAGDYTVDVTGAETIEIYYKPNVEIAAYLKDSAGNEVTDLLDLEAGEYIIEFGFVKGGTSEKVLQSKLLGDVEYEAIVTNNGTVHEKKYNSGDKVLLEEGPLNINVTAKYLKYHAVSTALDYTVFKNKELTFEISDNPTFEVDSGGFAASPPILLKAYLDGKELTAEQWGAIGLPKIELKEKQKFEMGDFIIEKSAENGIYNLYPTLKDGSPSYGTYSACDLSIKYKEKHGNETWSGEGEMTLQLRDSRSWLERNRDLVIKLLVLGILLFIIIGYLPFVKHYLPGSLKKKPYIKCVPDELGAERKDRNGLVEKNLLSTIIPYVAQTGKIKYVPQGVSGPPIMEVKGIKNRRMVITNIKAFVGKDYITFDGTPIKKDDPRFATSAGVQIRVQKNGWTYHCTPNQASK